MNHLLMPLFGTYGVAARVNYFFGFPRTMSAGGIVMDIGKLITITTPKNGNNDKRFGFVLQAGMLSSALEHTVPEQMFSTATQKAEAVSTVKLLNIAAQQGMPILHPSFRMAITHFENKVLHMHFLAKRAKKYDANSSLILFV
ncbi:MAG: hypothetical protein R8L53_03175 [Mariprofundales bacterium]